jgi:hypothetical protein
MEGNEEKGRKVEKHTHGRHSDCYWVEVSKRTEKMKGSMKMQAIGRGD